jgi:Rha family phage regulatory protein
MQDIVIANGKVSSKVVAEKFGKRHDDVLKIFRRTKMQLLGTQPADFIQRNFAENNINTLSGRTEMSEVWMTKDGFVLLAMGFTGKIALEWKIKFINAFNAMEDFIRKNHTNVLPEPQAKTARITHSVIKYDGVFGEPVYKRSMVRVQDSLLSDIERLDAKRLNLLLQAEGCIKKANKLEAEIEFLNQPPVLRLVKGESKG